MKLYLAAPFFKPEQVEVVEKLENLLSTFPFLDVYSPRKDGVLISMDPAERAKSTKRIFDLNVSNMTDSNIMVAVVDGRDQGVTWELGFFFAMRKFKRIETGLYPRIITYTDQDYGLNVMIKESVDAHCRGLSELEQLVIEMYDGRRLRPEVLDKYKNFDANVT